MKCCIMRHFIRVYTVCKGKKDFQTKNTIVFEKYNLTPLYMYNGLSQVYCIKPEGRIHTNIQKINFFHTIMEFSIQLHTLKLG